MRACQRATSKKPKRRTTNVVRRDERETYGLGAAIGPMVTERGTVAPAACGSVLADFDVILTAAVPHSPAACRAVAFDAPGRRPRRPGRRHEAALEWPKLIAAANQAVPETDVRAL
ncbi:hypothetical protein [Streptomyces sp. NPDC003688]